MSEEVAKLFAYGTLMPGQARFPVIESYVHETRRGLIAGVLVDLGAFPALVPGKGIVEGVLLTIDEAALAITDRIEGCVPGSDSSLYIRREVMVRLPLIERTTAWTYEFAHPERIADRPRLTVGVSNRVPVHAWRPDD